MRSEQLGYNLRSWASNNQTVATQDNTVDSNVPNNILGMHWNTLTDKLSLILKRTSSKIFDPIGHTAPVTVCSKLFVQRLWQKQVEWDETLMTKLCGEWQDILKDLNHLSTINRRYMPTTFDPSQVELHTYNNASLKAYGAVTFCNAGDHILFAIAKCHVASQHYLDLELIAAVIGARITDFASQFMSGLIAR